MTQHVFVAPAQMYSIASCQTWSLGNVPQDGAPILIDLRRLRTVTPTAVAGLIASFARWYSEGHSLTILPPGNAYAARMMETIGFVEAIKTFAKVSRGDTPGLPLRRLLPVIAVRNFRDHDNVESIAGDLVEAFSAKNYTDAVLNQGAAGIIAEAASNVLYHANCASGGFALAQLRERRTTIGRSWWIEIAVSDAGRGIPASLGYSDDVRAVEDALNEGVTRMQDRHRGIGLHFIEEVIREAPGRFLQVHSGHGGVTSLRRGRTSYYVANKFPGTLLTVGIPVGLP